MNVIVETKNVMDRAFNISELNELCWRMGLNFESVTSNYHNRNMAIFDIISYCQRHSCFDRLLDAITGMRPMYNETLNSIRTAYGLEQKAAPEIEPVSETVKPSRNYVTEMRQLAMQMLALCEEMENQK